ncbi:ATP-binding protein [Actinoplanes sp. NPDC051861]|uniref:ATP-binding protein n=1 Tax=Actinoplanes sp. NPDC051861 TaxID=3155170 RepID=UPI00343C5F47
MTFTFTKATKKAAKARIALEGPSGSGKTYTALITARALGQRIAVIDTEHRSASLYADEFDFDTLELDSYDPQLLTSALAAAAKAGYDVIVVDSLSHFWMGTDGMLEQVDRAAKRSAGGNTFGGWKEMRPTERRMIEAMLAYPGHLIATLRTKTEWVVEENDRGKKVPKKIGLKAEQREGLEYEFTLVGTLDLDNTLVVTKSRCKALSSAVIHRPDASFGQTLGDWLQDGEAGPTAEEIRDEVLATPDATYDELIDVYRKAERHGLLMAAIITNTGDEMSLGDFVKSRGLEAKARAARAADEQVPA